LVVYIGQSFCKKKSGTFYGSRCTDHMKLSTFVTQHSRLKHTNMCQIITSLSLTSFYQPAEVKILAKLETTLEQNAQISAGLRTKTLQCHHASTIFIKTSISHNNYYSPISIITHIQEITITTVLIVTVIKSIFLWQ